MSGGERERTPVDRVRRLSDTEATFAYTHALMGGRGGLTTSFTMNGVFSPERVEAAVELWLRRLPLLSLRIEDTGGGELWFRQGTPGPSAGERLWGLRGRAGCGGGDTFLPQPSPCDLRRPLRRASRTAAAGRPVRRSRDLCREGGPAAGHRRADVRERWGVRGVRAGTGTAGRDLVRGRSRARTWARAVGRGGA
ncbi:hypothetical protein [Streptomyces purpurascens]